jgi:hypothetical protein
LPFIVQDQFPLSVRLVFDGETALLDDGVHSGGGKEGRDTCTSGPDLLSEGALGANLELELAVEKLPLELVVFSHIAGDHAFDLLVSQQNGQAPIASAVLVPHTAVVRGDGQLLAAGLLDCVDQVHGHAAYTEAAH